MPYATREIVSFIKATNASGSGGASKTTASRNNNIREYPSAVMPPTNVQRSRSKQSLNGTSRKRSKSSHHNSRSSSHHVSATRLSGSRHSSGTRLSGSNRQSGTKLSSSRRQSGTCLSGSRKSNSSTTMVISANQRNNSSTSQSQTMTSIKQAVTMPISGSNTTQSVKTNSMSQQPPTTNQQGTSGNLLETNFDEKLIRYMESLIRSNLKRLKSIPPYGTERSHEDRFEDFTIDKTKSCNPHSCMSIYMAKHCNYPEQLVCKYYDHHRTSKFFFQVLRHLGKRNPHIVPTWEVFKRDDTVYVFQEFAYDGNLADMLARDGPFKEELVQSCAQQLRRALDFLGDMGLCHRSISPRHLLVHDRNSFLTKLSGFGSSIIYYDETEEDLNYQPCRPISQRTHMDFQAPEIYGDPAEEVFDPVNADIWSYGATLYNLLCGRYPYDPTIDNPNIEKEIQSNVSSLPVSRHCNWVLHHCLTTMSAKRVSIERLGQHSWLMEHIK